MPASTAAIGVGEMWKLKSMRPWMAGSEPEAAPVMTGSLGAQRETRCDTANRRSRSAARQPSFGAKLKEIVVRVGVLEPACRAEQGTPT